VTVFVINKNILSPVPNQWRLAPHGLRLELAQFLQRANRVRVRQAGNDTAEAGFNPRHGARCDAEFFSHTDKNGLAQSHCEKQTSWSAAAAHSTLPRALPPGLKPFQKWDIARAEPVEFTADLS